MSPFADRNLHLAVLDAAWRAGLLPEFDKDAFYRDILKKDWDAERDGYEIDAHVLEALLAIELRPDTLAGIQEIDWVGGHVVQHLIAHFWDGEDDTFDVRSLGGIAACANLRVLKLGCAVLKDLGPLAGLRKLETLALYFGGFGAVVSPDGSVKITAPDDDKTIGDLRPLLGLSALRGLDIGAHYRGNEANRAVLKDLQKRGVKAETREDAATRIEAEHRAGRRKQSIAEGLEAYKAGKFAEAVAALGPYEATLEGSDRLKLGFARKKLAGT